MLRILREKRDYFGGQDYSLFVDGAITKANLGRSIRSEGVDPKEILEVLNSLIKMNAVQQASELFYKSTIDRNGTKYNEEASLKSYRKKENAIFYEDINEKEILIIGTGSYLSRVYNLIKFKERDFDIKDALFNENISFIIANCLIEGRNCKEKYKDEENVINGLYRHFVIPKKKKGEFRDIYEPVDEFKNEMKNLNRVLQSYFNNKIKYQTCNQFAYIQDRNIVENAKIHRNNKTVVKVDISKYFESIKDTYCRKYLGYLCKDDKLMDEFMSYIIDPETNGLYMGNPISGTLANLVMYPACSMLTNIFKKRDMNISVYSDDITVSTNKAISKEMVESLVLYTLDKLGLNELKIKKAKTKKVRNQKRVICGVTINHNNEITISRDNYDRLRVTLYKLSRGEEINIPIPTLIGRINFYLYVDETGKFKKLLEKYKDTLKQNGMENILDKKEEDL